jgi:hypothetical protein
LPVREKTKASPIWHAEACISGNAFLASDMGTAGDSMQWIGHCVTRRADWRIRRKVVKILIFAR